MKRSVPVLLGSMLLGAAMAFPVSSSPSGASMGAPDVSRLALPSARTVASPRALDKIDASLQSATGEVEVVVQLADEPLAVANGPDSRRVGGKMSRSQQMAYSANLRNRQAQTLARIMALGGKEVARVHIAYNAVIVRIDASKLRSLATMPEVVTVRPIGEYHMVLDTTVPYVGASAAHGVGLDGTGVRVAVLDSGIDYTHRNLGGPGTVEAYVAAYGTSLDDPRNTTLDGLFPTEKVVGGFDFVGELWPNGPRTEDPDPIDFDGHGTHVADIIAGRSADGSHVGVAPGATLYGVKVCSSISTSCNGVALLLGLDFALDPNGDGSMDDAVDVINLSLGAPYGQIEDDLSAAAANAVRAGVVVVAAAGNSGDRPYISSSPASAPGVISVANTQVPTAVAIPLVINSPPAIAGTDSNTATIDWAPVDDGATGDVVFVGRGCLTGADVPEGGDPLLADPAGKIALVDRGSCNISEKVRRLSDAGAIAILIGLVAPGDAISFSNGGDCPFTPDGTCVDSLVITQATSNLIKGQLAAGATVNVTVSQAAGIPLIGSMVSSSSRGPTVNFSLIKPDIGAPGGSVSAEVGTGTGETAFSGTSGATPMVSGAVALLLQAYPHRSPAAIKSLLMNTADPEVYLNPAQLPGVLAPITRIGAGELRVDRALRSTTAAWDAHRETGSLSFGYHALDEKERLCRPVRVRNYTYFPRLYKVDASFRYPDDEASRAVRVDVPRWIVAPPNGSSTFQACIWIDPARLPVWTLNGGSLGGTGSLLQSVEFDGYITIEDFKDEIRLAWHVLTHRAADVEATKKHVRLHKKKQTETVHLHNRSRVLDGRVDVFSLTGTSPRIPKSQLPGPGDAFVVVDLAAVGVRLVDIGGGEFAIQFGINTFGKRAHPAYPGGFEVQIDTNLDGAADWFVFNGELGAPPNFFADGRTVVYVQQAGSTTATAFFFADADLNSGNIILTAPLSVLGLGPTSQFRFSVLAFDNYHSGLVTDAIENMTYTAGVPRFFGSGLPASGVPAGRFATLTIEAVPGGDQASPSQTGLLLLYRDAEKTEAETITVQH